MGTLIHFVYFCTQCEATAGGEWSILTTFTELYPKRKQDKHTTQSENNIAKYKKKHTGTRLQTWLL